MLIAGWCTSAETALLRVSRAGAKELGRSAGEAAESLQAVMVDAPRYLSVVLLARVAAEISSAVLVTAVLVEWFGIGWKAFLITAIAMTVATYLLAGLAPRAIARRYPVKVASAAATVLRPVLKLLGPLPRLLASAGAALTPGQVKRDGQSGSEEDLRGLVDLLEQRQIIEPGERAMIHSVHEHPEGESIETVGSIMRPATFAPESKPVDDLLGEMQARHVHMAIVIDEYGGTAGLVTIEDILEEIVGEIADEYDRERPPVEWLSESEARVTARLSVEELEELFDVTIDAEDVETVGGLLAHRLGRVPIAGSVATISGLKLTAESLAGRRNRIGTVTVQRLEDSPEPAGAAPAEEQLSKQAAGATSVPSPGEMNGSAVDPKGARQNRKATS